MSKLKGENSIFYISLEIIIFLVVFLFPYQVSAVEVGDVKDYSYTGGMQSFTAPVSGYYQLEGWGGQGYTANGRTGGYGAYTTGVVRLQKNETIYIAVGAQGSGGTNSSFSSWSNGGKGTNMDSKSHIGAGGASTNFTTVNKTLASITASNLEQILLVAAGGGSGTYGYGGGWYGNGGHGGGISGNNGSGTSFTAGGGGTQTSGGYAGHGCSKGSFGAGASGAAAGGGGFYGGGCSWGAAGGGGSSYIGNSRLISYDNVVKSTYCYSCATSMDASTYTVNTTSVNSNAVSQSAKTGKGSARITLLYILSDEARLSNINVSKGVFDKPFDKDTYTYNIVLDEDDYNIDISATTVDSKATVVGEGNFNIPAKTTSYNLAVTAEDGTVATYVLNITRPPSSYKYLSEIKVNDEKIADFQPEKLEYTVNLSYDQDEISLDALFGRPSQIIDGLGNFKIPSGTTTKTIEVTAEDKKSTITYKIHFVREHSSILKSLEIDGYDLEPSFNGKVYEYEVNILSSDLSLNVNAIAYDEEATITLDGFGYIKATKTATITVKEPNSSDTVYTIKIVKGSSVEQITYDFPYTGGFQEFTSPIDGFYKLETWGAQGYSVSGYIGGYGAYAVGATKIKKGETVYVNVGGAGSGGWRKSGFSSYPNGGIGNVGDRVSYVGAGGSSTNITTTRKNLVNITTANVKEILIVAAGGGSATWTSGNGWYGHGGAGGGIVGNKGGTKGSFAGGGGGTQTTGGTAGNGGSRGSFGKGGNANSSGTGGGGGFYGGGSSWGAAGGGGSSYIANPKLQSYKDVPRVMYCYYCQTSDVETTATETTANYSSTPTPYYAKTGNGHARITLMAQLSKNNFLSEITTDKGTIAPDFDMMNLDYKVKLTPDDDTINIGAVAEDETAEIIGTGEFDVPAGKTKFPITVTAENGDIRIYTLEVERDSSPNSYPNNIIIDGLIPNLCSLKDEYCKLDQEFNPDTASYQMTVPSRLKKIKFIVEKGHKYQTVKGDGEVTLETGMNEITIEVTSEDGEHISTYTYYIDRDMSGDNNIENLEVVDPVTDIEFDPDTTEYYFSIPDNYTKVDLKVTLEDPKATYEIVGNENFKTGLNIVEIVVTAQNGDKRTYTLNIYREQSGNTFLSSLEVSTDKGIFDLNPKFNKIISVYTVNVANEIEQVEIKTTTEHPLTIVTGGGVKNLKVGTNVFTLTSTAEDGSVQLYEVSIIRHKNSDATLKTLDVLEGVLSPTFQSSNFEYSVDVNPGVTSLNLNIETTAASSKYIINGNYGFKVGVDNVVSIVVTAEDGTKNTYTIHVNRKASTNNYLSYLNTDQYDLSSEFSKEIEEYSFSVENNVSKLSVVAEKEDSLATLTGNGSYHLDVGDNDIFVVVTAEDGTSRTYTLHVFRKYNNNANLSSLTTDTNIAFNQTFDKDTLNYSLTVGSEVEEIAIVGVAEVATSKVTGNGVYPLNSGENLFKILVTAEDGTEKEYSLLVVKEKSSNANLSMIIAKESVLDPAFEKHKTEYVLKVIESVTSLSLLITPEDSKSTYKVIGNENFEIGNNTVVIKVTAEDGTVKEYTLDVLRQEAGTTSNRLLSLEVSHGTLDPTFDSDTNYYEVEVPYEVSDITLSGELEDKNATVTGFGTYQLNVGINVLSVKVTSVENVIMYYQVVVTRAENDEARLASLQVSDTTINPNFNRDIYEYQLTTTDTELKIQAVPLDSEASVDIIGNKDLALGDNQVIIRVTAKDKKTKKDYVLNIVREKSNNNNLQSLEVVGHTITPQFSKGNTVYYLDVPKDVELVNIVAVAEDKNATVTGDGEVILSSSLTYAEVKVTSESGKEKVYTIIIIREQSSNNYLDSLEVSSGTLSPEFQKTDNNYTVTVSYEIEDIDISGSPEDNRSTVTGFGTQHLQVGVNMIPITVRAEDGSVNIYYLEITREKLVSSKLKELSVQSYSLNQTFYPEVYDYNVSIDSEVDSLVLNIVPEDADATYRVLGNNDFVIGMNIVKIIVTDSLGKNTSTYTLNVSKQNYSNTFLSYIYTSVGTLSPNFIKTTLDYTVHVGSEVEEVEVLADPEVSTNTLTGDGIYHLVPGDNMVELKVETPTGISRVYHVNIIREKNSKNHLLNLQVKVNDLFQILMPEFSKDVLEYTLDVAKDVTSVEILGKAEDGATVSGLGVKLVKSGVNLYQITVTSEDGEVKIYKLTVNKEQSDNNHLIDIIPSIGTLSPSFSYNQDEYSLVLDASASVLSFDVVKEDVSSMVTGITVEIVPDGLSKREIVVEAENGSKKIYTINVYKEKSDEARLSNLEIDGYAFNEIFDKDTYNYTLTVPNDKNVILSSEVEAIPIDSNATVTKTSSLMLSSTVTNIYTVVVTAKDGFTKKTYTIAIDREKGSDSTLAKLEFAVGNLTESFVPSKTEYTLQVPKNSVINRSDVEAIPTDSDATVNIPYVFNFTEDNTVYEIVVESADKSSTTTYTVHLEVIESSNALLSDLSVDHGILSPSFDKTHNSYTLELDSEVDELEISATAEDVGSIITGDGKQTVVTGLNRYEVVVTAEDGTVNTYVIEATRKESSNTNILDIIPSSGSLSPSYSNEVDTYEVTVSEEIDTIDFDVQLESKRATVTGDKGNTLEYGDNDITITVTAEDKTTKEVHIKVIREKKVTDIEVVEEILIEVGDVEVIDTKIIPEDATNKELIWEVVDDSIVSVEDGVVTGLSLGETYIKVSSKANEKVSKTIKVSVLNLKITSDIYDVRREDDLPYIIGAEQGEKLSEFITKLNNKEELIHFYNADDTEITDLENEQVTTGSYITLEFKDKVYDKVYIAVRGDVNGDGEINVKDYNEAVNHTLKKKELEDYWFVVANVDDEVSGIINVKDSNMIQNKLLKKITSLNP